MKKLALVTAIPLLITALSLDQAQAVTFTETDDAGETLNTAQVIPRGTQTLTSISGILSGEADLFQIFLTGGQTFSATTINLDTLIELPTDDLLGFPSEILADPQLFLFDSLGKGVYANDDSSTSSQALLPSGGFSPAESGTYFLAISSFGYNPVSAGGMIFSNESADGIFSPTGSGGNSALIGFEGTSTTRGRYTIALTGVQTTAKSVPEPSSLFSVLVIGALATVSRYKDKRNNNRAISN
ncbi:MAG: hypothetical protein LDL41_20030 [Coleofasciculus sp. S288]|nr:hypothetical protein [Coleofasciculus sp. S288]